MSTANLDQGSMFVDLGETRHGAHSRDKANRQVAASNNKANLQAYLIAPVLIPPLIAPVLVSPVIISPPEEVHCALRMTADTKCTTM